MADNNTGQKYVAGRRLKISLLPGETEQDVIARTALRPSVQAGVTIHQWTSKKLPGSDLPALVEELRQQCAAASRGEFVRSEAMLIAQAHTLDAIFNDLARRAQLNVGQYLGAADTYLRLALRAQTQCRATLETLATIKNPPNVAFVKQANIANGPQQVNNGTTPSRAGETEMPRSKLLEESNVERMDYGSASATVESNSHMAAVESINRTQKR